MINGRNSNISIDKLIRFSKININDVYRILKTSIRGISNEEAGLRRKKYGENKIENSLKEIKEKKYYKVTREGAEILISVEDLTIGDVIHLNVGEYVPADVRIIHCNNLYISEYTLTGRDTLVKKHENIRGDYYLNKKITELDNICLKGTEIVKGTALGIVIAIGNNTYYSKSKSLSNFIIKRKNKKGIIRIKDMIKLLEA